MALPDGLITALSGRYRIERELGTGGMATVYLAHDIRHDRDVAIKVLRPELTESLVGGRFTREISITARLNHPHILAVLDSGESDDPRILYYVMPVATGESLADRLARDGALPVSEAVTLAIEVVEALAYAHGEGVVHRDIKPDNILLSQGHAVIADFGIAKAVRRARVDTTLTTEGTSLGTPLYMAPEQVSGEADVDHRADIYAVGALMYTMIAGKAPFSGTWAQVLGEKMSKDAPRLSAPGASAALVNLIARCMARDPAQRPQSAAVVLQELRALSANGAAERRARGSRGMLVAAAACVVFVLAATFLFLVRDRRARWVHETAMPMITRLIDEDKLDSAFVVASEASSRAPGDTMMSDLFSKVSQTQTFLSNPPGAEVTRASLGDTTHWLPVGTTPTAPTRIPLNAWFYRYAKAGYRPVTIMGARMGGSFVPIPAPVLLRKVTDPDTDMAMIPGGNIVGTLFGLEQSGSFDLADFLMDKLEVTNRQYKAFVDAGGYTNRTYWDSTITPDVIARFVDKTGRPGPSSWEGGAPPAGSEDLPVGGVSWYEARAYARFAGKEIPTVFEWNAAAIPAVARWVVQRGQYESSGPVRGGSAKAVGPRGVYDLAGNVREWTINERETGERYILGGGWSDPAYLYSELYTQPALDRSAINGIRLIRRLGTGKDIARASAPITKSYRDPTGMHPVDDATFRALAAYYEYDRAPLNAKVDSRDTTNADWVREDVSFDVARAEMRMHAVLFLPKRARPPYQTVFIWPASDAFILKNPQHLSSLGFDYIIRSGRAVVYPIFEHTYGRGTPSDGDLPRATIAHRDQVVRWVTELRRTIDYALTRTDVDSTRLAFDATSWGSRMAAVAMAVEPRFKAAVVNVAGIGANAVRPEEDAVNFLPRVKIPVLMLSGKFDSVFPVESSQLPYYHLLGTPPADKKRIEFDGGHFLPRTQLVSESLNWFDHYLGPVSH